MEDETSVLYFLVSTEIRCVCQRLKQCGIVSATELYRYLGNTNDQEASCAAMNTNIDTLVI
jgi:hypothetical protein